MITEILDYIRKRLKQVNVGDKVQPGHIAIMLEIRAFPKGKKLTVKELLPGGLLQFEEVKGNWPAYYFTIGY